MAERESKDTLRAQVKRYILKGISDGTFAQGERIVETRLAKDLQMSQAPVREAILELSIMGVLEERPYSGSFVRKMGREDVEDHYRVRALIEGYAASCAAELATGEELQAMRFILHEMAECSDYEQYSDLDHRFHSAIIDASHNIVLKRIWLTISTYEWTYQTILTTHRTIPEMTGLHRKLYDVIAAGKTEAAGAEMFLHIDGFKDEVVRAMAEKALGETREEQEENGLDEQTV